MQTDDRTIRYYSDDSVYKSYTSDFRFRAGEEAIARTHFHADKPLLDIGCGAGRTTFLLQRLFSHSVGLDISERLIQFAARKAGQDGVPLDFLVGDATTLPFPDHSFDNVLFSFNGIEGLPSPELRWRCLREAHRVLRPGGVFILSTHTFFSMVYQGFHVKKMIRLVTKRIPFLPPIFPASDRHRLGDVIFPSESGDLNWHITNPFGMLRRLRRAGFRVVYANSAEGVVRGRRASARSFFGAQTIFYVARKP